MRNHDEEEAQRLGAKPWQTALLKLNPDYVCWGPHEDYMWKKGDGWDSAQAFESWEKFGPWKLDDLNECAHFYFQVTRDSKACETCGGNGYHPDAQWVSESFYSHSSPFTRPNSREDQAKAIMARFGSNPRELHGRGAFPTEAVLAKYGQPFRDFCNAMRDGKGFWSDEMTEDEEAALREAGRHWDGPLGHDAINRGILVEARCKRLGLPTTCQTCDGHGSVYVAPEPHVNLVLWWLHPRKGCSRGLEVRITERDLPDVFAFLAEAADRNAGRFTAIRAAMTQPTS